jgi:type III restriction enzyme
LEELADSKQVISYVKNAYLGFAIPYTHEGKDKPYFPDFIARCKTKDKRIINLIIEVTGMNKDKAVKKEYVLDRWLPAVNAVRDKYEYDEWHFIEIANDIRDIKNQLKEKINSL